MFGTTKFYRKWNSVIVTFNAAVVSLAVVLVEQAYVLRNFVPWICPDSNRFGLCSTIAKVVSVVSVDPEYVLVVDVVAGVAAVVAVAAAGIVVDCYFAVVQVAVGIVVGCYFAAVGIVVDCCSAVVEAAVGIVVGCCFAEVLD